MNSDECVARIAELGAPVSCTWLLGLRFDDEALARRRRAEAALHAAVLRGRARRIVDIACGTHGCGFRVGEVRATTAGPVYVAELIDTVTSYVADYLWPPVDPGSRPPSGDGLYRDRVRQERITFVDFLEAPTAVVRAPSELPGSCRRHGGWNLPLATLRAEIGQRAPRRRLVAVDLARVAAAD